MGYTTEFDGTFSITPALSDEEIEKLNAFCQERHGGNMHPWQGFPGFWCDFDFSNEVNLSETLMRWNGNEKSYYMTEWANYLRDHFFPKNEITGQLRARGEEFDDIWTMKFDKGIGFYRSEMWSDVYNSD